MLSKCFSSILEYIDHWADETPGSPAWCNVTWNTTSSIHCELPFAATTWHQFRLQLLKAIESLYSLDLPPQSRVVTCDRNSIEWVMLDLACQATDCVHVPIDTLLSDSAKRDICIRLNPSLFVLLQNLNAFSFLESAETLLITRLDLKVEPFELTCEERSIASVSRTNPESVATILFTSGTTSTPKGVQLSHRNLLSNAMQKLDAMPQHASDRRLNLLPFSHAYARTCELSTWLLSGSSLMTVRNIDHFIEIAPIFQPTLINGVPYIFEKIRQRILSMESQAAERVSLCKLIGTNIRMLAAGGAGLDTATYEWFAECGYPIYQGYGLTEAGPVVCSNRFPNPSGGHVGFPVCESIVRIDEDQRMYTKGPGVMVGYFGDVQASRNKISNGWLDTGDLAEWTAEGAIRIIGRSDDRIILTNGYKVDPGPLEHKIAIALKIRYCSVVSPDLCRVVVILPVSTSLLVSPSNASILQDRVREALSDEPNYVVSMEALIVEDDWTYELGMLNSKGSIQRSQVVKRYFGGSK